MTPPSSVPVGSKGRQQLLESWQGKDRDECKRRKGLPQGSQVPTLQEPANRSLCSQGILTIESQLHYAINHE